MRSTAAYFIQADDWREGVGDERRIAECRPPFSSMGAGGVVNGSGFMEEWYVERGAARVGWL